MLCFILHTSLTFSLSFCPLVSAPLTIHSYAILLFLLSVFGNNVLGLAFIRVVVRRLACRVMLLGAAWPPNKWPELDKSDNTSHCVHWPNCHPSPISFAIWWNELASFERLVRSHYRCKFDIVCLYVNKGDTNPLGSVSVVALLDSHLVHTSFNWSQPKTTEEILL